MARFWLVTVTVASLLTGATVFPYVRPIACDMAHAEHQMAGPVGEHQSDQRPALTAADAPCHDAMLCCAVDGARNIQSVATFAVTTSQRVAPPAPAQRPPDEPAASPTPPPKV